MSEPSFDVDIPDIQIIDKPQHSELTCDMCGNTFKNTAGLNSHKTHKHSTKDKTKSKKKREVELSEVYKGDLVRMLIPQVNTKLYDRSSGNWVYAMPIKLPEGFVLYTVLRNDVVHNLTDLVPQKRSFMQILAVRKDKVLLKYE